ncbi:hypothetical protein WKK05_02400 [Nostoc sp. UHCC 0302]
MKARIITGTLVQYRVEAKSGLSGNYLAPVVEEIGAIEEIGFG